MYTNRFLQEHAMSIKSKYSTFQSFNKRQLFWLTFLSFAFAVLLEVALFKLDEAGLMKPSTSTLSLNG